MREEKLNYEEDTNIDEMALDVEWLQQAELMRKYVSHQAQMKKEMNLAKERLDMGKAKIEMDIRSNPEKYELKKVTESAIQSAILLQEEYQKLFQEYISVQYENDVAVAAVRAIDQKKTALENLVKLLGSAYFAGPKAPRDLSQEWGEKIKERERKALNKNVKIKRRSKKQK